MTKDNEETRKTVTVQRAALTGALVLVGRETATAQLANVFVNAGFQPVEIMRHQEIHYEAEVAYGFTAIADDDPGDRGEIYRFRFWRWSAAQEGAVAEVWLDWQDFEGDDVPGAQYGWDKPVALAVARMRRVRYEKEPFTPVLVGSEKPE